MGLLPNTMSPAIPTFGLVLALCIESSFGAAFNVPSGWVAGQDYVVIKTVQGTESAYGGYIFPGPAPNSGNVNAKEFHSADGYYCEAKHYDGNYGIFETAACANMWTQLTTTGRLDASDTAAWAACNTIASQPCGCQK